MNADYEKRLGHNIRMLREKRDMTQEQLSAKLQLRSCDITRSALAKIEVGQRHVYADEIFHLKNILKVSYEDIFPEYCDMFFASPFCRKLQNKNVGYCKTVL